MKQYLGGVVLVAVLSLGLVAPLQAAAKSETISPERKAALLLELKQLQVKLDGLLQQFARLKADKPAAVTTAKPQQLEFFDLPFTGIYFISSGKLVRAGSKQEIDPTDQELFTLFKGVVGEEAIRTYFTEWRTFDDDAGDLGGFVELVPKVDRWVIGVNQADYFYSGEDSRESYISLFVHEYAHVLLYDKPKLVDSFKKQFWTKADTVNQKNLERLSGEARFEASLYYYEQNSDRFVSDYATVSTDEDMAETFVTFILEDRAGGLSTAAAKQNFFYTDADMVAVRTELQKNLDLLGY